MAINAQDILDTLANSVTYSTLTPGTAANAGGTAKGQEVNAYAKAMKIIKQNTTYINNQSGTNTAAGDAIEEIFYSHQYQAASPYSASGTGSYDGNVVEGNNTANGFNALFLSNAIQSSPLSFLILTVKNIISSASSIPKEWPVAIIFKPIG